MINYKGYKPEELGVTAETATKFEKLRFYNVKEVPELRVYGLYDYKNGERFTRMPEEVAEKVSNSVKTLNYCTAGGRVRFVTTSNVVAVRAKTPYTNQLFYWNPISTFGFDIYINNGIRDVYFQSMVSDNNMQNEEGMCDVKPLPAGRKEITINLPLYKEINELYIGLDEESELCARADYRFEKPVLYYGSSITQGACTSRPGMTYESIISRRLDTNFINLGFSGACQAEPAMREYLKTVDCSVFVYDYDHNSTVEGLAERHEALYKDFRETHPDTPVIIVGRPDFFIFESHAADDARRREILMNTYKNAFDRGENVIYIDGYSLFAGEDRDDCIVDGTHPNDLGYTKMAEVIGNAVEFALGSYKI